MKRRLCKSCGKEFVDDELPPPVRKSGKCPECYEYDHPICGTAFLMPKDTFERPRAYRPPTDEDDERGAFA